MDDAKDSYLLKVLKSLPTQQFPLSKKPYLHKEFAEHTEPLVGLEKLIEMPCANVRYEPGYFCSICNDVIRAADAIPHVASRIHRERFFVSTFASKGSPTKATRLVECGVTVEELSRNFELNHGRSGVFLMFTRSVDADQFGQTSYVPTLRLQDPSIASAPPLILSPETGQPIISPNICEPESNADLKILPVRPFDSTERCFIYDAIASHGDTVVGAEIVIEMQCEDAKFEPTYFCGLCEGRFDSRCILGHLTCKKHRHKYLNFIVRDDDHLKGLLRGVRRSDAFRLAEAAKYFEEKNGRKQVAFAFTSLFKRSFLNPPRKRGGDVHKQSSLPDSTSSHKRSISYLMAADSASGSEPIALQPSPGSSGSSKKVKRGPCFNWSPMPRATTSSSVNSTARTGATHTVKLEEPDGLYPFTLGL